MTSTKKTSPATASAHTPGPWRLDGPHKIPIDAVPPNYVEGFMVMNPDERQGEAFPTARVTGPAYFGREDECDPELVANARLIAAAPDLLEACEYTLELLDRLHTFVFGRGGDAPAVD